MVTIALVAAAPASAKKSDESFTFGDAAILGPVKVRGDVAYVRARYSCDVGNHIWVSVKQSASGEIDPAVSAEGGGFGGAASAWWQSHRGSFACDGKRHVASFTVDTVEPGQPRSASERLGLGAVLHHDRRGPQRRSDAVIEVTNKRDHSERDDDNDDERDDDGDDEQDD